MWLNLLSWLIASVGAGSTVFLLLKLLRIEAGTLGEILVIFTALTIFGTGLCRTLTPWNLPICVGVGMALSLPLYLVLTIPFVLRNRNV